jgi:hypothetical protein
MIEVHVALFWWKDIIKLFGKFKVFGTSHPNTGISASLRSDNWSGQLLELSFPHLFYFTRKKTVLSSVLWTMI